MFFLTGCFGSVETIQCLHNGKSGYFVCRYYKVDDKGFWRGRKKWRIYSKDKRAHGMVCVPPKEYTDNVWPKMKEAWEYCKDTPGCF